MPPSKTVHDQLCPLPRSSFRAIINKFSSKRVPITVIWTDSDLDLKMSTNPFDTLSTFVLRFNLDISSRLQANKISPDNRDWCALGGKCINNRTRGRSRKGAELLVYCFRMRHLVGSNLNAGYSIPLRFELSAISGRCQKIVSGLIIMDIWQVGRLLRLGFGVVPAIIYHCNAEPMYGSLKCGYVSMRLCREKLMRLWTKNIGSMIMRLQANIWYAKSTKWDGICF